MGCPCRNDQPRVRDAELWVTLHEIPEKAMLLGVVRSSGQVEDHRVTTLELRESPEGPALVLELVVRKGGSNNDAFPQLLPLLSSNRSTIRIIDASGTSALRL